MTVLKIRRDVPPRPPGSFMYSLLGLLNFPRPFAREPRLIASDVAFGPDRRHRLDIYSPRGAGASLPVIIFLYGGSWNIGERGYYAFAGKALAALGYVVVVPDYRLVPSVEYPSFLEDTALAVSWTRGKIAAYGGDPDRIALIGHSAGAYNAAMVALSPRYRNWPPLRAIVGLSGPYDFYPFDVPVSIRTFGAARDLRATQPVNLVTSEAPPMLLLWGDKDTLVSPNNSKTMARTLRAANVPVVERPYPNLGHAGPLLSLAPFWRRRAPVLQDIAKFLAGHLQRNMADTDPAA